MIATAADLPVVDVANEVVPEPPAKQASAVRRLPPSERDVEVYRAIVLEGASTREAAAGARVSQTRVRQIVAHVVRWIEETLPAALADELPPEVALKMAQALAAQRLELMYSHAMTAWRNTGQPRYLGLAIRVTTAQTRLPLSPMLLECLLADARGPEELDEGGDATKASATPRPISSRASSPQPLAPASASPDGDCSPPAAQPATHEREPAMENGATLSSATRSRPLTREQALARRALLAGAGPLLSAGDDPANSPPRSDLDLGEEELLQRVSRRQRKLLRAK